MSENDKTNKDEKISDQQLAINLGFDVDKIYQSLKAEIEEDSKKVDSKYKDYDTDRLNRAIFNRLSFAVHPDRHDWTNEGYANDASSLIKKYHPDELKKNPISIMNTGTVVMDDGFTFTIKRRSAPKEKIVTPPPRKKEPIPEKPSTELELKLANLKKVIYEKQILISAVYDDKRLTYNAENDAYKDQNKYLQELNKLESEADKFKFIDKAIVKEEKLRKFIFDVKERLIDLVYNGSRSLLGNEFYRKANHLLNDVSNDPKKMAECEKLEQALAQLFEAFKENPHKLQNLRTFEKKFNQADITKHKNLIYKEAEASIFATDQLEKDPVKNSALIAEIDKEIKKNNVKKLYRTNVSQNEDDLISRVNSDDMKGSKRFYGGVLKELKRPDVYTVILEKLLHVERTINSIVEILPEISKYSDKSESKSIENLNHAIKKNLTAINKSEEPDIYASALLELQQLKKKYIELAPDEKTKFTHFIRVKKVDKDTYYGNLEYVKGKVEDIAKLINEHEEAVLKQRNRQEKGISGEAVEESDEKKYNTLLKKPKKEKIDEVKYIIESKEEKQIILKQLHDEVANNRDLKKVPPYKKRGILEEGEYKGVFEGHISEKVPIAYLEKLLVVEKNMTLIAQELNDLKKYEDPKKPEYCTSFQRCLDTARKAYSDPIERTEILLKLQKLKNGFIELGNSDEEKKKIFKKIASCETKSHFFDIQNMKEVRNTFSWDVQDIKETYNEILRHKKKYEASEVKVNESKEPSPKLKLKKTKKIIPEGNNLPEKERE
jgi:hypothetical protein